MSLKITRSNRRAIAEVLTLQYRWNGAMSEHGFLNELYDLHRMPSTDSRREFNTAYLDIEKHRAYNDDWDGPGWVFADPRFDLYGCSDQQFGEFLELVVSGRARPGATGPLLAGELNKLLATDGYVLDLVSTGKYVCQKIGFKPPVPPSVRVTPLKLSDRSSLDVHLTHIEQDLIGAKYDGVVTGCKDLLETLMKLILDERRVSYTPSDGMTELYAKIRDELDLTNILVPSSPKCSEFEAKGLSNAIAMVAQLRNKVGRGHGHSVAVRLKRRNAQHVMYATWGVATTLFDVWNEAV
ncbi:hypothetical protein IU469_26435 [Nocardia puris]|uniref:AbiJ-related protein n=1 Tax=Nocardia TaxID=1817 RepID=UPI0018952DCD|nr:hypothetical protein [Nocardia puris]MBF6369225.1 hypothetical protein [Nocardia puris]